MLNFAIVVIVVNRISFPISKASYSTPQLSPSKEVYSIPFYEETMILITVRNVGRKNFNITHITGYLHAAHSFDFLVENYMERVMNVQLSSYNELTVEYRFEPWNGLPSVDYVFSCDLGYILQLTSRMDNIGNNDIDFLAFQSKFANVTISVYDSSKLIDFELFFMLILILGSWGAVAWVQYELFYVPDQQEKGNSGMTTSELLQSLLYKVKPFLRNTFGIDGLDA